VFQVREGSPRVKVGLPEVYGGKNVCVLRREWKIWVKGGDRNDDDVHELP